MCASKTLLKIGVTLAAVFAVAWFALPDVRAQLIVIAPFALVAVCPLAMLGGMYGMHRMGRGETKHKLDCCAHHPNASVGKEKETVTS